MFAKMLKKISTSSRQEIIEPLVFSDEELSNLSRQWTMEKRRASRRKTVKSAIRKTKWAMSAVKNTLLSAICINPHSTVVKDDVEVEIAAEKPAVIEAKEDPVDESYDED